MKELYELGITEVETGFGHKVRAYDRERCICELVMNRGKVEVQHFQTALKGYMKGKEKELSRLIMYAEKLKNL